MYVQLYRCFEIFYEKISWMHFMYATMIPWYLIYLVQISNIKSLSLAPLSCFFLPEIKIESDTNSEYKNCRYNIYCTPAFACFFYLFR